jgi:hypothetical protein
MADFRSSLGDSRITSGRLFWPAPGRWTADLRLAEADELAPGPQVLAIGNLTLVGSVVRGGSFAGSRMVRVVAGLGGWGEHAASRFYSDTNGVKLSAVLRDVASDVGELLGTFTDRTIGTFYARAAEAGSRVLSVLVGRDGWYVDDAGVTQIGTRPSTVITSAFDIPAPGYQPHVGILTVATEDLFAWRPGAIFEHELLPTAMQATGIALEMHANGTHRLEVMV